MRTNKSEERESRGNNQQYWWKATGINLFWALPTLIDICTLGSHIQPPGSPWVQQQARGVRNSFFQPAFNKLASQTVFIIINVGCMVADSDFEFEFELTTRVQTWVRVQTRVWVCVVDYGGRLHWTSPVSDYNWPGRGWEPPSLMVWLPIVTLSSSLNSQSQLEFKHEFDYWVWVQTQSHYWSQLSISSMSLNWFHVAQKSRITLLWTRTSNSLHWTCWTMENNSLNKWNRLVQWQITCNTRFSVEVF